MFDAKYGEYTLTDGVVYANCNGEDQRLDIYSPVRSENDKAALPMILFVHGGGLHKGDRKQSYVAEFCGRMVKNGYLCLSVDYRLSEQAVFRDENGKMIAGDEALLSEALKKSTFDVNEAIKWTRANADSLGGDPERVALCGGSAGGMIINTLCYGSDEYTTCRDEGVKAIISLWGAPWWMDCVPRQGGPAAVYLHGTKDAIVPFEASVRWHRTLSDAHIPGLLMPLYGGGHTCVEFREEIDAVMRTFLAYQLS